MVEAFSIEGTAHIAHQLLADTSGLKGADLGPQAFIHHGAGGIETHTSQLFTQLTSYSEGGVNAVIIKVNQSNAGNGRVHIFIKGRGCSHGVTIIGSNECVGNSAQALALAGLSVGIGGKALDAADFSSITIGLLSLINIITSGEEEHGLAVGSLHYLTHVGSDAALTSQNTQINSFQMSKILVIAFNSHHSFPFLYFITIMQRMDYDVFRMEGTGFQQGNNLIGTANHNLVTSKNLHQNARMIVVAI